MRYGIVYYLTMDRGRMSEMLVVYHNTIDKCTRQEKQDEFKKFSFHIVRDVYYKSSAKLLIT